MINKDKLLRFIGILDETLGELKAISELDKAQVLSSRDRFAMENLFYRLAMACIDICFHVVAKKATGARQSQVAKRAPQPLCS